jgi:hypothetical protein
MKFLEFIIEFDGHEIPRNKRRILRSETGKLYVHWSLFFQSEAMASMTILGYKDMSCILFPPDKPRNQSLYLDLGIVESELERGSYGSRTDHYRGEVAEIKACVESATQ